MEEEEVETQCPFCGESITVVVDVSVDQQDYVEDCSVCCKPMHINVRSEDGTVVSLDCSQS